MPRSPVKIVCPRSLQPEGLQRPGGKIDDGAGILYSVGVYLARRLRRGFIGFRYTACRRSPDTDTYAYAYADTYADTYAYAYTYADTYAYAYAYTYADTYTYTYTYTHSDAAANGGRSGVRKSG